MVDLVRPLREFSLLQTGNELIGLRSTKASSLTSDQRAQILAQLSSAEDSSSDSRSPLATKLVNRMS